MFCIQLNKKVYHWILKPYAAVTASIASEKEIQKVMMEKVIENDWKPEVDKSLGF